MPGIVGYFGFSSYDLSLMASCLKHHVDQKIHIYIQDELFGISKVTLDGYKEYEEDSITNLEKNQVYIAVDGDIFECNGIVNDNFSKSEAFLHNLYNKHNNISFLNKLDGLFSVVIVDKIKNNAYIMTDNLGMKRIYYATYKDRIIFSSEIHPFSKVDEFRSDFNPESLDFFLKNGYLDQSRTWLKNVKCIAPGSLIEINLSNLSIKEIPDFLSKDRDYNPYDNYKQAITHISDILNNSFHLYSRSKQQYNLYMSNGFEDRIVFALMNKDQKDVNTFFVDYNNDRISFLTKKKFPLGNNNIFSVNLFRKNWFQNRMHLAVLGDCINILDLHEEPILYLLQQRDIRTSLMGFPIDGLLSSQFFYGYADYRKENLAKQINRFERSRFMIWNNFSFCFYPFLNRHFIRECLRLDTSYLLNNKIISDICLSHFHDIFNDLQINSSKGSTTNNITCNMNIGKINNIPRNNLKKLYADHIIQDKEIMNIIYDILTCKKSLFANYIDHKHIVDNYFKFKYKNDMTSFENIINLFSLEIWFQYLYNSNQSILNESSNDIVQYEPLISIIIPAYNVDLYIAKCINSLINQTYTNIEIIFVDDGSTDSTKVIIEEYAEKDSRIKLICTKNNGVYRARNIGVENAKGDFIAFVDADDYVHHDMIIDLFNYAYDYNADISFCDVDVFSDLDNLRPRKNTHIFRPGKPMNVYSCPLLIQEGFTATWSKLIKKKILDENNIRFDEKYTFSSDMLYMQEVLLHANQIVRVPKSLYFHRHVRSNSLTTYNTRNDRHHDILEITCSLIKFWIDRNLFNHNASYILTKSIRNIIWNSFIDEDKLKYVFDGFCDYILAINLNDANLSNMPNKERELLSTMLTKNFNKFIHRIKTSQLSAIRNKKVNTTSQNSIFTIFDIYRAMKRIANKNISIGKSNQLYNTSFFGLNISIDYGKYLRRMKKIFYPIIKINKRVINNNTKLYISLSTCMLRSKDEADNVKILHFTKNFSTLSETFTYDIINGLENFTNTDNYVMFFNRYLELDRPFDKLIHLNGWRLIDLENENIRLYDLFDRILNIMNPKILHCHFGWIGIPMIRYLQTRKPVIPIVITMHGTDVNLWPNRYIWYRDILKNVNKNRSVFFTTHTKTYKNKLIKLGIKPSKIEIISNSFSPKFDTTRQRHFRKGQELKILSIARMDIWKGHEYLLKGFSIFHNTVYKDSSLTLVGDGKLNDYLRKLSKDLNIDHKVRFLGEVNHDRIPDLLLNHDIFIQPSIKHSETHQEEGQPISVLEAIVTGIPVIVTDTGAMAETVRIGDYKDKAFIINEKNESQIAEALINVLNNKNSHKVNQSYIESILQKHSQKKQIDRTNDLYLRITKNNY